MPRETPIGMIKSKGKDLYKDLKLTISLKYPSIKAYISVKKNRAAREALMTAGSAAIINKYNASAYAVGEKIENLNMLNDFNVEAAKNSFSFRSIESRNNFNFNKSSQLNNERNELINRYLDD